MTSQEIIEKIRINTIELSDILKKLEDRPTLVSIGVTESDEDEDAVEDAIFEIKNWIRNTTMKLQKMALLSILVSNMRCKVTLN